MNDKLEWFIPVLSIWGSTLAVALFAYLIHEVETTKRLEIQTCGVKK